MTKLGERVLIYSVLAALCALTSAIVNVAAGLWSFVQVVAVIELIYWVARPIRKSSNSGC